VAGLQDRLQRDSRERGSAGEGDSHRAGGRELRLPGVPLAQPRADPSCFSGDRYSTKTRPSTMIHLVLHAHRQCALAIELERLAVRVHRAHRTRAGRRTMS